MRPSRLLPALVAVVTAAALAVPATATASPRGAHGPGPAGSPGSASSSALTADGHLGARAAAQIEALSAAKAGRSPSQAKVDSRLLQAADARLGVAPAKGVAVRAPGLRLDRAGRADVQIRGTVTASLLRQVGAVGGTVLQRRGGLLLAAVPVGAVQQLAVSASVTSIAADFGSMTAGEPTSGSVSGPASGSKADRARQVEQRLQAAVAARRTAAAADPAGQGSVVSEGDATLGAAKARRTTKVRGAGVTVGVLSDGVDSLATSIETGDLPPSTRVLPGQAGSGDEGTAMLEIVHDVAPTAKLLFATANPTQEAFAANIRALRAAGADIIVDDVVYFAESPFQDGTVAQAVIDVTDDGALYFSSAGNEQNVDDRTAGNYEGDYVSSGVRIGKYAGSAHDFAPGAKVQALDPVSDDSAGVPAILQWADPLGHAKDDYDLYAVDADGNVLAYSNTTQNGDDDPFEGFYVPDGTVGLAVVKFKGAARYFQVTPFRGRFAAQPGLTPYNTPGVTRGHSTVPAAYSVAAVPAAAAFPREIAPGVSNPSGPYPAEYTSAQTSERFTSDGPRRVFFTPTGKPITPGNFTHTGGTVRQKPDVTSADGVSTSLPDFTPFFGTSAAAPHAAAVAALALSGNPGITPVQVRAAVTASALDIEAAGRDRDTGVGILMADRLLARTGATPQPLVEAAPAVVTPAGDGDAYLEPGESGTLTVPVTNTGDAPAASVAVQVTTDTAGVTVTPANRSVGAVAVGTTKQAGPFTIAVASSVRPGTRVQLTERVSFVGALSPQVATSVITVGQPSTSVVDVRYTGPAVPIPDDDPAGASVPLTVSGVGALSGLTVSIDGTACSTADGATTVGLDHTFDGDLVGTLTAPGGTVVTLFSGVGGAGNNFCRTVFDDAATAAIQDQTATTAPFTGSWKPAEPLQPLVGTVADGTWTFTATDTAASDTGSIRAVSLHLRGYEPAP